MAARLAAFLLIAALGVRAQAPEGIYIFDATKCNTNSLNEKNWAGSFPWPTTPAGSVESVIPNAIRFENPDGREWTSVDVLMQTPPDSSRTYSTSSIVFPTKGQISFESMEISLYNSEDATGKDAYFVGLQSMTKGQCSMGCPSSWLIGTVDDIEDFDTKKLNGAKVPPCSNDLVAFPDRKYNTRIMAYGLYTVRAVMWGSQRIDALEIPPKQIAPSPDLLRLYVSNEAEDYCQETGLWNDAATPKSCHCFNECASANEQLKDANTISDAAKTKGQDDIDKLLSVAAFTFTGEFDISNLAGVHQGVLFCINASLAANFEKFADRTSLLDLTTTVQGSALTVSGSFMAPTLSMNGIDTTWVLTQEALDDSEHRHALALFIWDTIGRAAAQCATEECEPQGFSYKCGSIPCAVAWPSHLYMYTYPKYYMRHNFDRLQAGQYHDLKADPSVPDAASKLVAWFKQYNNTGANPPLQNPAQLVSLDHWLDFWQFCGEEGQIIQEAFPAAKLNMYSIIFYGGYFLPQLHVNALVNENNRGPFAQWMQDGLMGFGRIRSVDGVNLFNSLTLGHPSGAPASGVSLSGFAGNLLLINLTYGVYGEPISMGSDEYTQLQQHVETLTVLYELRSSSACFSFQSGFNQQCLVNEMAKAIEEAKKAGKSKEEQLQAARDVYLSIAGCGLAGRDENGDCIDKEEEDKALTQSEAFVSQAASSGSSSSIPIPIVIGVAAGVLVLVIVVVVVAYYRLRGVSSTAPAAAERERVVVAFENPMYDDPGDFNKTEGIYNTEHEGLYDEPAFNAMAAKENPMYSSADQLDNDNYDTVMHEDEDTGYLDVNPDPIPDE